jgi:ubiquinone biosynthesis protein
MLHAESLEGIGRAEARRARWGNAALWIIAAALLYIAWHTV